jgi:hypothetical protein
MRYLCDLIGYKTTNFKASIFAIAILSDMKILDFTSMAVQNVNRSRTPYVKIFLILSFL